MEREIKFRLICDNKIIGYEIIGDDGWRWMCLELNSDKGERWTLGVFPSSKEYKRVQYTGLKDSNGKEIYEGDQLFVCAGYSSTVEFQDGMFVSVYRHPEDGETIPLSDVIGKDTVIID